jgi:hypothetical protein
MTSTRPGTSRINSDPVVHLRLQRVFLRLATLSASRCRPGTKRGGTVFCYCFSRLAWAARGWAVALPVRSARSPPQYWTRGRPPPRIASATALNSSTNGFSKFDDKNWAANLSRIARPEPVCTENLSSDVVVMKSANGV